jgi:hypothetical protein
MTKSANAADAECGGPKYDAPGAPSARCIACGKCDAVQRLMRDLVPTQMNTETMRTAANAAR